MLGKKTAKKSPSKKPQPSKEQAAARDEAARKKVAKKAEAAKESNVIHARVKPKGAKMVQVKALVNMECLDGCQLVVGKVCEITDAEAKRLEKDERGPFFESAK